MSRNPVAIQDDYGKKSQVCYGCGSLNDHGLQLKTFWDGQQGSAEYLPRPEHIGFPGFVYGGLIASLIDCHAMATAAAWFRDQEENDKGVPRMVTASLQVQFLKPTALDGNNLVLQARVTDSSSKKAVVSVDVISQDKTTARGEVIAVKMPESMKA